MGKKKLVFGVGINDLQHLTEKRKYIGGKYKLLWYCPFYCKWKHMLERCYSEKHLSRYPTYRGNSVCEEWHLFSNFKRWMETQDWENKQLDKDLLIYQNKIYSPETCVLVPNYINSFMTKRQNARGLYPLGVTNINNKQRIYSKPYRSNINNYETNQQLTLGYFKTPQEAHREWQLAKIKCAKYLIQMQTDTRIISGLQRIINKIQNDYDNNLETIDF